MVDSARSRMGVLTRLEKEEETKGGEVGCGHRQGVGAGVGNNIDVVDYRKGDGFDAHGWRVDPLVAFELLLEAVLDLALGSKVEVFGPHTGHRLANGTEGILHCVRADSLSAGSDFSSAPALGKDLEERDWVDHIVEHGIDAQLFTIAAPQKPGVVLGSGKCRNCAGSRRRLSKH